MGHETQIDSVIVENSVKRTPPIKGASAVNPSRRLKNYADDTETIDTLHCSAPSVFHL